MSLQQRLLSKRCMNPDPRRGRCSTLPTRINMDRSSIPDYICKAHMRKFFKMSTILYRCKCPAVVFSADSASLKVGPTVAQEKKEVKVPKSADLCFLYNLNRKTVVSQLPVTLVTSRGAAEHVQGRLLYIYISSLVLQSHSVL